MMSFSNLMDIFDAKVRIIFQFWGNVGENNYFCRTKFYSYEKDIVDYQFSSNDFSELQRSDQKLKNWHQIGANRQLG